MKFNLETDRLRLRQFQDSVLETFLAYRNDPEFAKYQGWEVLYPREMALDFVENQYSRDNGLANIIMACSNASGRISDRWNALA
jgi:RimJ/RimL family protein N-acetyltransferase